MFGITSPWVYVGALVALIAVGAGGYFYGHSQGVKSEKAALADQYQAALDKFVASASAAATQATADAMKDFNDKTAVLAGLSAQLESYRGTINAAASKLSASLKGGTCLLQPAQRQLLECMRRPGDASCVTAAPANH